METETQACFGAHALGITGLVDALAGAVERAGFSLDHVPHAEAVHVSWHTYDDSGSWVHCTPSTVARGLAGFTATLLGRELSLFEASFGYDVSAYSLKYLAHTISAEGRFRPAAATALDGIDIETVTSGSVCDRLSQMLGRLAGCHAQPVLSHSFKVFSSDFGEVEESDSARIVRPDRVAETVSELRKSVSATLGRYDVDGYEYRIQTSAGYPLTIYVSVAEMEAVQSALSEDVHDRLTTATVHGPLGRSA